MSQENVEVVRDLVDRWNSRDTSDTSYFQPDVEFLPLRAATEGPYHGIAGIERFLADTEQTFETFQVHPAEMLDLGEQVLVWGTGHARMKWSGIEIDFPIGGVFDFRDGKIARFEDFGSRGEALKAVGLEE